MGIVLPFLVGMIPGMKNPKLISILFQTEIPEFSLLKGIGTDHHLISSTLNSKSLEKLVIDYKTRTITHVHIFYQALHVFNIEHI